MILIPEIETVAILVPRTGSGSLRRAIKEKYPRSMLLYRHMEADGVPKGYDQWRRIGVVRHPTERLWSLYKFMRDCGGGRVQEHAAAMLASVQRSFSDWILHNEVCFATPYSYHDTVKFSPHFLIGHALPENRKSQYIYLRPDLGTDLLQFNDMPGIAKAFGVEMAPHNCTVCEAMPQISDEACEHVIRYFSWDLAVTA